MVGAICDGMTSSAGAMLAPEEENDADVRRADQENINKFGGLNARLHEARDTRDDLKVCFYFLIC